MKIANIGVGEVGLDSAKILSQIKYDVSVQDCEKGLLSKMAESLDVFTIEGMAASVKKLKKDKLSGTEILICVMSGMKQIEINDRAIIFYQTEAFQKSCDSLIQ